MKTAVIRLAAVLTLVAVSRPTPAATLTIQVKDASTLKFVPNAQVSWVDATRAASNNGTTDAYGTVSWPNAPVSVGDTISITVMCTGYANYQKTYKNWDGSAFLIYLAPSP